MNETQVLRYAPEYWTDVEGYEGIYQVSNLGNVKSLKSNKLLSPYNSSNGYKLVSLSNNGKRSIKRVHRLVMEAFKGESNLSVDHINGIKADNNLCNLRYLSNDENTSIARKGIKGVNKKLQTEDVIKIKHLLRKRKKTQPEIALQFQVSLRTIEYISSGKTWTHVA